MGDMGLRTIVQITGHTWWLHFLPAKWKARVIAENIRLDYGGNFPSIGIEMQLSDGTAWLLQPKPGNEPLPKHYLLNRTPPSWWARPLSRMVDWLLQWGVELARMTGTAKFARWEPVKLPLGTRAGGPL